MLLLVIGIIFVAATALFLLLQGKKRPKDSPPVVSLGIPLIGNYLEFATNPVRFIEKAYKKHGPIFTVPMFTKNLTFLIGPEACAPFFRLSDDYMSQKEVYGFMTPIFGKGVVYDAEPKKRTQQFQSMANGLRKTRLQTYVPKIEMETLNYVRKWGESGTVNLLEALSELTILSSSRCLHGDDVRENIFEDVARIYHDLDKGVTPLSFFFPYAPTPAHALRDKARKEMVEIFSKIIHARRNSPSNEERTDIVQIFIDLVYKDDKTILSDEEIVGLLLALLFAGQHTSSIGSTWTAMFLLHNSRCMEEVMKEQKSLLGEDMYGKPLTFADVDNMEYLQNCIKEALRLHPPLIMLMRMALHDIVVEANGEGYTVPQGDIVITSPAVASRLGEVFKNPDAFEPERFNAERNEQKTPYAYLGFGGGMHACIGQQFGLLQIKTIVSILLRNFKFELVDKEFPEPDYTAMVVGPKNHLMVKYTRIPGGLV